jgi:copper transport protein
VTALRRFSAFIPFAVAALIAAGAALAFVQVQQPAALVETAYGRLLLAKFGLLAVLFALAAVNRWSLTHRVARDDGDARRRLVRRIAAETLVMLVIFGIAAGWRFTPPPRALAEAAAQPATLHIHTSEAMADLTVTPGRAGPADVSAILMTGDFGALDAREVTFVFSSDEAGIEPFERRAEKPGDGSWRAAGVVLPLAGRWTVRVDILIDDFTLVRIAGDIDIRP